MQNISKWHNEHFYIQFLNVAGRLSRFALLHTEYSIRKGLYLSADIGLDIDNNFEDYKWHIADGKLHHVRQDRRLYLTEGESGIRRMAIDYLVDINKKNIIGFFSWLIESPRL